MPGKIPDSDFIFESGFVSMHVRFCQGDRGNSSSAGAALDHADSFARILTSNCQMSRLKGSFSGKVIFCVLRPFF